MSPPGALGSASMQESRWEADDILDLCTTCDHGGLCLSRKTLIRPVHYCEQFEARVTPGNTRPMAPPRRLRPVEEATQETSGYSGICVNCDLRRECRNSRDEAGIWHCEEYV